MSGLRAGQISALKKLLLILKFSPQLLNSNNRVNFSKLPETRPYTVLKVYKVNIFNTGKISIEQSITCAAVTGAATLFIAVTVSDETLQE